MMNTNNPYTVPQSNYESSSPNGPNRISIGPLDALFRGYKLLGDKYWMFMGICFVGILIASLVPLGILMGPMLVGIFMCLIEREQGKQFDFNTLFRGFERFVDSLIAMIIMTVTNLILVAPLVIVYLVAVFSSLDDRGQPNTGIFFGIMFVFWVIFILAAMVTYLPYMFCFQLIADRKLPALEAIKLSARGVWLNLGPLVAFAFVGSLLSFVLTLMCYIPVFFFIPVWFAASFVIYREAFPETVVDAQAT